MMMKRFHKKPRFKQATVAPQPQRRNRPKVSICVPSRNRQRYFQETIRSLLKSTRPDIEFVFADNSDDPAEMRDFMSQYRDDARIRFLEAGNKTLSMVDNWERCIAATTGDWLCLIGDDDYVDPNVADLLSRLECERPNLDVLAWRRVDYNWPDARPFPTTIAIFLEDKVVEFERKELANHFFGWAHRKLGPLHPFSVYHSAVSRRTMETIKRCFGGRYFEHECVDYDNFCKIIAVGKTFMFSTRPLSVAGTCALSNSAGIGNLKAFNAVNTRTFKEFGRNLDEDDFYADFPFTFQLGVPAITARCQHWFKKTYGLTVEGWEENFVHGCRHSCFLAYDKAMFDHLVSGFKHVFSHWKGGKYLSVFGDPKQPFVRMKADTGVFGNVLQIDETIGGVTTPSELYDLVAQFMPRIDTLTIGGLALFQNIHEDDEDEATTSGIGGDWKRSVA